MLSVNERVALVLESAAMVVSLPDWHTKGEMARNSKGWVVDVTSNNACRFCALGAIEAAVDANVADHERILVCSLAVHAVGKFLGRSVEDYNDQPSRSNTNVSKTLWKAAQNARNAK